MRAVETLVSAKLVHHRKTRPTPEPLLRSTIWPTDELIRNVPITHLNELLPSPSELLQLKDQNKRYRKYIETPTTRRLRDDIVKQNEALRSVEISLNSDNWLVDERGFYRKRDQTLCPARNQYYRVFNISWRSGGRWYGPYWQQLSACDRGHLLINGEDTIERDYPYFYPQLLAAAFHCGLGDGDPYDIKGLCREDAKRAFSALVCADSERSAIQGLQSNIAKRGQQNPGRRARQAVTLVKERHPQFGPAWGKGVARRLQNLDGEICAKVQAGMRKAGHVVLSVHDSFIVQHHGINLLSDIMDETLEKLKRDLQTGRVRL